VNGQGQIVECNTLHIRAMDIAEEAFIANHKGKEGEAVRLYREAYELEAKAAELLSNMKDLEPTRSVLYRSAASLAMQVGELDEAFRLACEGLAGNPPAEIAEELWEVIIDASPNVNLTDLMNVI